MSNVAIANALGALLLGGLISLALSGIVCMQAFLYFRVFRADFMRVRGPVAVVWIGDLIHSCLVCAGNWRYLIQSWGDDNIIDFIPISIALTVLVTATVTFIVQTFFTHRVLVLSKRNWIISGPMFLLAFFRLVAATASTALMIKDQSYDKFVTGYSWVFTFGLTSAAALDILITISLCYYLRSSRTGFGRYMDEVVDTIMLYTIQNNSLTCTCTIISLICWVVMPHNLIFLGIHFAISKLYANSFLATINAREGLRDRSQGSSERGHALPVLFPNRHTASNRFLENEAIETRATKLEINVEKTVHCEVEGETELELDMTSEMHSGATSPEHRAGNE